MKNGIIAQIMQKTCPICEWCALHGTSHKPGYSDIKFLSLVSKIESLLVSMYNYFVHSSKHHLETTKLVEILECKGNKILKHIKACRISMLSP